MRKKNNKKLADWQDVKTLIRVLNSDVRTHNPSLWRKQLVTVFNVRAYLKWLAINTVIVNWDTYGSMAHNFYLYNDPIQKLTWIPWDNNETLKKGMGMKMKPPRNMPFPPKMDSSFQKPEKMPLPPPMMENQAIMGDLSQKTVSKEWPLTYYLLADRVFKGWYKQEVKQFSEKVFTSKNMIALVTQNYHLLKPEIAKEHYPYSNLTSSTDFEKAYKDMLAHVEERIKATKKYLHIKN